MTASLHRVTAPQKKKKEKKEKKKKKGGIITILLNATEGVWPLYHHAVPARAQT